MWSGCTGPLILFFWFFWCLFVYPFFKCRCDWDDLFFLLFFDVTIQSRFAKRGECWICWVNVFLMMIRLLQFRSFIVVASILVSNFEHILICFDYYIFIIFALSTQPCLMAIVTGSSLNVFYPIHIRNTWSFMVVLRRNNLKITDFI